jgi:hypothetical protein
MSEDIRDLPAVEAESMSGGFEDSEDVLRQLFRNGDPDRDEFSELTDFALVRLPDRPPEGGAVRILCHLVNHRYRLVMRNGTSTMTLLNHFVLPGTAVAAAGQSVAYVADDYADPARARRIRVELLFESPIARAYFELKFAAGARANGDLMRQASRRRAGR